MSQDSAASPPAFNRYSAKHCTFRACLRGGVWQVTRDYVFFGDFESRAAAIEGAIQAAVAYEATGGRARVLGPPGETLIPHQGRVRA